MQYMQAGILREEDGVWYAEFPQFDGAMTDGETLQEAAENAADLLVLCIAECIDEGREVPPFQTFGENPFVFVVSVTEDDVMETKCVTIAQAAEELGVSKSRVHQLLKAGLLEAYEGRNGRMVTIQSLNARKAAPRRAGRPKAVAAVL